MKYNFIYNLLFSLKEMFKDFPFFVILIPTGIFILLFIIEKIFPLRERKRELWQRFLVNILISVTAYVFAVLLVMPATIETMELTSEIQFGILYLFELPFIVEAVIAFLLLDLAYYYWHLLNHKIPFLWRFHNIHHIDPDLDISTGLRFHFGEIFFSTIFRIMQVGLIGVTPIVFIIYETVFLSATLFHHSNLKIPVKFERLLNRILVTPRMHGIHHSFVKKETDSNYSTILPWWDWLQKTIRLNIPQQKITIGVPAYSGEDDNKFLNALLIPFREQRKYWTDVKGKELSRDESEKGKSKMKMEK